MNSSTDSLPLYLINRVNPAIQICAFIFYYKQHRSKYHEILVTFNQTLQNPQRRTQHALKWSSELVLLSLRWLLLRRLLLLQGLSQLILHRLHAHTTSSSTATTLSCPHTTVVVLGHTLIREAGRIISRPSVLETEPSSAAAAASSTIIESLTREGSHVAHATTTEVVGIH